MMTDRKQTQVSNANNADLLWQWANFTTLVAITSGLTALIHSPLNTLMMDQITTGRILPQSSLGMLFLMRHLYTGFGACLAGTSTRAAYMSGTKKINQDSTQEKTTFKPKRTTLESFGFASAMSMGELCVTHVPEVLSQLRKAGIIQKSFLWDTPHNLKKLSVTTSGARFCFGLINCLSLCEAEQFYADHLPIKNNTLKHFTAGIFSGTTAAFFSYPFGLYRDYHLSKMRVENHKLISPGAFNLWVQYYHHIKQVGFYSMMKTTIKDFCVQAPLRIARTSSRFALIAGISAWFKNEPLTYAQNRFFTKSSFTETEDSGIKHTPK